MIEVFLPDGSSRQLPEGATGLDLANSIGRRLAQDAVAVRINEQLSDIYLELKFSYSSHKIILPITLLSQVHSLRNDLNGMD